VEIVDSERVGDARPACVSLFYVDVFDFALDPRFGFFALEIPNDQCDFAKKVLFSPTSFRDFTLTELSSREHNGSTMMTFFPSQGGQRLEEDVSITEYSHSILTILKLSNPSKNTAILRWIEPQTDPVLLSDIGTQYSLYVGIVATLISIFSLAMLHLQKVSNSYAHGGLRISIICTILLWPRFFLDFGTPKRETCLAHIVSGSVILTIPQMYLFSGFLLVHNILLGFSCVLLNAWICYKFGVYASVGAASFQVKTIAVISSIIIIAQLVNYAIQMMI
jgi:hypothetical protein